MAKKERKQSRKRSPRSPRESQKAEAITVFWMTSLLATVIGEAGVLVTRSIVAFIEPYPALQMLSGLLLLISCVTGILCLALIPLVLRWRRMPPPVAITRFAVVAGLAPWLTLIAVFLFAE